MTVLPQIIVTILAGYLLGNLNGAVSISTLTAHEDVREAGSGNAGLTNFCRTYGWQYGAVVALIDLGKTLTACMVGRLLLAPWGYALEGVVLAGIAVTLGHDFPATLGFRGGKGILCGAGIALIGDWRVCVLAVSLFLIVALISRYVSLGSIVGAAALAAGFALWHADRPLVVAGGCVIAALAIFMHRENIARLLHGRERKLSIKGGHAA